MNIGLFSKDFAEKLSVDYDKRHQSRRETRGKRKPPPRKGGGSGGGGSDFAIVTPTGEVCDGIGFTCDCAIATVVTASCGSGTQPGDQINVWDLCRLWLNMPNELLTSTNFYCQKVKIHEDEYNRPPGLTGSCRWVVTGMCCVEVDYYGY